MRRFKFLGLFKKLTADWHGNQKQLPERSVQRAGMMPTCFEQTEHEGLALSAGTSSHPAGLLSYGDSHCKAEKQCQGQCEQATAEISLFYFLLFLSPAPSLPLETEQTNVKV